MLTLLRSMLIFIVFSTIYCLTCTEVQNFPPQRYLSSDELKSLAPEDIVECLQHITQHPFKPNDSRYLWEVLVDYYIGIPNIPEEVLSELHWITPAIHAEEYDNITIGSINLVRNFGFSYNLDEKILEIIANHVRDEFAGKTSSDYSFYDLVALNQILCAFNSSEIDMIHPSAYREAASVIGKLENCNPDVMLGFGRLSLHRKAFGPSQNWTGLVRKTVGNVVKYLPKEVTKEFQKRTKNDEDDPDEINEPADEYGKVV